MNRRKALSRIGGGAAALFGIPAGSAAGEQAPLPDPSLCQRDPERYWQQIRDQQFLLPGWRAFLNNGSLGIAPRVVVHAIEDYLENAAALAKDEYPRWGYELLEEHRAEIAEFAGCKTQELALTHCATESMCIIAGGLDLRPGDEVLLTDQEHPSGRGCWEQKAARYGISVRTVNVPLPPASSEQLADILTSAIGPRTRVISFSGITSATGLVMPIREICEAARAKGVISVVDGAHMNGQVDFRLSELGCDFFAGSPHKWLFAPAGCGLLYIREEMLDRLWPLVVTGDWEKKDIKAARFMRVGTNNRAIFEGLIAGLRFARSIGPERIYRRIHELAGSALQTARARPYLEPLTPADDRLFGAMVSVKFKPADMAPLWKLCDERRIWTTKGNPLRISTHIHTRPADVDLLFEMADRAFHV